jgi:glycosyltransferase involved in cell wall biosynthesis
LKVAFIDHTAVLGGGEIALCNLIEHLDREQWQPLVILGTSGPLVDRLRMLDAEVEVRPLAPVLTRIRQDRIERRSLLSMMRAIAAAGSVIRLARQLKKARAAVIHANSLRACVIAGFAGRLTGIPVIWQIHSVVGEPMMSRTAVRLIRGLARWLPDRIVCNSKATAACFRGLESRIRIIPCGSDTNRYAGNGRRGGASRVGMIARFSPLKGQHIFIEAASQVGANHPEAEFVLAGAPLFGEQAYAAKVQNDARNSPNSDRIRFLGFVDDVPALLHDLDIVVQPSIYPEGLGQSVLEAMMAGKPVIASASGGLSELIDDGATGRLIPPADVVALRNAIEDLLADPVAAGAMGERARQRATQLYDIHATARAVERVYAEVIRS